MYSIVQRGAGLRFLYWEVISEDHLSRTIFGPHLTIRYRSLHIMHAKRLLPGSFRYVYSKGLSFIWPAEWALGIRRKG